MKICVMGAGIIGLTVAYRLTEAGHEVQILEKEQPFAGASHRSFAWINANNKSPESYYRINAEGIEAQARLQELLGERYARQWFHRSGNILLDFSTARPTTYAQRREQAEELNYPVETLSAQELDDLEPSVHHPAGTEETSAALLYPSEGYLDNDILRDVLLTELDRCGMQVQAAEVVRISSDSSSATVHYADDTELPYDRVVVATGAESGRIAEASGLQIPMADLNKPSQRTHSLLGLTEPTDIELNHVLISDRINVRPRHDGRLWVQAPMEEHRTEEGESEGLLSEVGKVMEKELKNLFGVRIAMEDVIFSGRSFPADGHSIIGFVDDAERIYATVTHSGMTLAALIGELTVQELGGEESLLLEDFRPSRFDHGVVEADDDYFIGKQ